MTPTDKSCDVRPSAHHTDLLDFTALNKLIMQKVNEGKIDEALQMQRQVLLQMPRDANAHFNLGILQSQNNQEQAAIESYSKAIQLNPTLSAAYFNLGVILREQGDHLAAIHCNLEVVKLEPQRYDAYNNLAVSYIAIKNFPEVASCALKALAINPHHADSFYHLGIACNEQGNSAEALTFLRRAAALNPANNNIRVGLAFAELGSGDLESGWKNYECRWHKETQPERMRHYPYPWWQGEPLHGKTILVWAEQGVADQITFCSMIDELSQLAGHCILACAKKLMPLFARSFPTVKVIDLEDKSALAALPNAIDVQSASGSLARWLRPDIASFGHRPAYLLPDPQRVAYWKKRLAEMGPEPKVGIGWRSGNVSGDRKFYCTQIEQWGEVFAVGGVQFINLQYDDCVAELRRAQELFGVTVHAFAEVDLFDDIDETAALTQALDLVIAAPTTSVIIAGAVGTPAWIMTSGFNWQYLGTDKVCWLPDMVPMRRPWHVPWEAHLAAVADELRVWVKQ